MTQFEFYKSFQFVWELLLAEFMFVFRFHRRSYFPVRAVLAVAAVFAFAWFFPVPTYNAYYCAFLFSMIFAFTVIMCKFLFKETWLTIVFCCVAGYTVQHFAYEAYNLILNIIGANAATPMGFYGEEYTGLFSDPLLTIIYVALYVMLYFVCFFLFSVKLDNREPVRLKTTFIFLLAVFILLIDILLNAIVVYNSSESGGVDSNTNIISIYNIICCVITLYLQFEVALSKKLESSLNTMRQILHQVKEQYSISKENIALINMKCHDLKHQIRVLDGGGTVNSSVLRDIEDRISIYDSLVNTGNDALNTILTEKSLLCNKHHIRISCIVDGGKLNFIAEEDIYALFGNIVDNAIAAVAQLDPSKRVISLQVKAVNDMLQIREFNYYDNELRFENGIPVTTKDDKEFHGFGIQSIQHICEKYDGNLSISTENNVFSISILFFLK